MLYINKISEVDLQLFAEGAAADGASGVTVADAGQQPSGVQPADPSVQTGAADAGQQPQQDPNAAFEQLITGQYKDQYNKRVEDTVRSRLKGVNQSLKRYAAAQPIFDILAQQYGLEPTDLEGLAKAAQQDASFFEKEAAEKGMDVQELMRTRRIEREYAALKRDMEQWRSREAAERQYAAWSQEAEQLKTIYPGFDINVELQNERFGRMLSSGVDVRTAYEVVHKDEIIGGAMQFAAQKAAQQVTDTVIAGAARPAENGTGAQGAVATKVDPSKLTEKEIRNIRARVARGETVTF